MTLTPDKLTVLGEISERARAREHHEHGTGRPADHVLADWEHREMRQLRANGTSTWRHELQDATSDVYAADDWPALRDALIATAALCLDWLLDGDRQ